MTTRCEEVEQVKLADELEQAIDCYLSAMPNARSNLAAHVTGARHTILAALRSSEQRVSEPGVCEACGGNGYSGGEMPENEELRGEYDFACEVCFGSGKRRVSEALRDGWDIETSEPPFSQAEQLAIHVKALREAEERARKAEADLASYRSSRDEAVERVARALFAFDWPDHDWEGTTETERRRWNEKARAAIEALSSTEGGQQP